LKIMMTGLDYTRADLDTRSQFAVTKERSERLIAAIKEASVAQACVIVSTCNRTELYASVPEAEVPGFSLTETLCTALGQDYQAAAAYFEELSDDQALVHLCRVAAGLDSQILGDDQIITQTREALELARAGTCTDSYIETFFRIAIQTAKSIKTNVILKALGAASVPQETVEKLKTMTDLSRAKAVVIGNGVIGRHVANLLLAEGAEVTVTIRQYHRGAVEVPEGAGSVSYTDRYEAIEGADILISATTSNHFTVRLEDFAALQQGPRIIVDLAVPRDVEASVADLEGTVLLTVDNISGEAQDLSPQSLETIDSIIEKNLSRFNNWCAYKQLIDETAGLLADAPGIKEANGFFKQISCVPNGMDSPLSEGQASPAVGGKTACQAKDTRPQQRAEANR